MTYEANYYSPELYHHGILGMKWGIRRFQNEDGTLTEAGRKRYNKLNARVDKIYDRKTRDLRNITENPDIYTHKYNRDRAQIVIDKETKLRDLRKAEIDEGFNYMENRLGFESIAAYVIGGLPLTTIAVGADYLMNSDQWKNRSEITKEYKDDYKKLKEANRLNGK